MTEQYKLMMQRLFEEVLNQRDLNLVEGLFDKEYRSASGHTPGPEGVRQSILAYLRAFPDVHFTMNEVIVENDMIAVRWTASGRHQGNLMGIPPTHNRVILSGIAMYQMARGKIVRGWLHFDRLHLMQQLGVVPLQDSTGL
jgi:predicted ester cyclase